MVIKAICNACAAKTRTESKNKKRRRVQHKGKRLGRKKTGAVFYKQEYNGKA